MKEYKDYNPDHAFFIDDQFFIDHEAYIHYLAHECFLTPDDLPDEWHDIAHTAEKEKMFQLSEHELFDWLYDENQDRWPEHEWVSKDIRNALKKHFDIASFNAAVPELWYGTDEKMIIRRSDVIEDLRAELES